MLVKNNDTAPLQEKLIGALIGLARATDGNEHLISASSTAVIIECLHATMPGSGCAAADLEKLLSRVEDEKRKMVPNCFSCASPCGRTSAYDMSKLQNMDEDIRILKFHILDSIRRIAACAYKAAEFGTGDDSFDRLFYKALIVIGIDGLEKENLLPIVREVDEVLKKCNPEYA